MAQTAEITVKIDKHKLDEIATKRISELENELGKAIKREERAKKKLQEAEGKNLLAQTIINDAEEYARKIAYDTDLWLEFDRA